MLIAYFITLFARLMFNDLIHIHAFKMNYGIMIPKKMRLASSCTMYTHLGDNLHVDSTLVYLFSPYRYTHLHVWQGHAD